MAAILPTIQSPRDLKRLSVAELEQLAAEMREALCNVLSHRTAHFASNLGVVELCLALHTTFDFSRDRLIWDTGHQIYPHKLITGRYREFRTIRTKGGLMGYPNPDESDYDLFMTGHAGCSVSTVLGLRSGDDLLGEADRHAVAVIGDGALPSGIVFEALNNAGGLEEEAARHPERQQDVDLSARRRRGRLSRSAADESALHRPEGRGRQRPQQACRSSAIRSSDSWPSSKRRSRPACTAACSSRTSASATSARSMATTSGMLRKYLEMVKDVEGPVLLHVVTEKGHGFKPAADDPVLLPHAGPIRTRSDEAVVSIKTSRSRRYTDVGQRGDLRPDDSTIRASPC